MPLVNAVFTKLRIADLIVLMVVHDTQNLITSSVISISPLDSISTSTHFTGQDQPPALQSPSRQNHRVERMLPEVNQRVNYPVKRVLVEMESNGEIDMTDDVVKFCVLWTTISIIKSAIRNFVNAWNCHRRFRGGIPNIFASNTSQVFRVPLSRVPMTEEIVQLHRRQGRTLTEEHVFGRDPLGDCNSAGLGCLPPLASRRRGPPVVVGPKPTPSPFE